MPLKKRQAQKLSIINRNKILRVMLLRNMAGDMINGCCVGIFLNNTHQGNNNTRLLLSV